MSDPKNDPNRYFRAKLGGGQGALKILLSEKPVASANASNEATDTPQNQSRVRDYRPKPEDFIPRKPKKGGINFYDLGQIKSGDVWVDIPSPFNNVISLIGIDSVTDHSGTSANWDAYRDYFFATPIADWPTHFKKLGYEEAEKYGLDVYDVDADKIYPVGRNGSRLENVVGTPIAGSTWTPQGLQIDGPITNFEFRNVGAFNTILSDPSFTKITTGATYGSPSVSFSLQKKADVFLGPGIVSAWAFTVDSSISDGPEILYQVHREQLQRSFWLTHIDPVNSYPILTWGTSNWDATLFDAYLALLKANGSYYTDGDVPGAALSHPSPTGFPAFGDSIHLQIGPGTTSGSFWTAQQLTMKAGAFIMAIKQDGTVYYFWNVLDGVSPPIGLDLTRP